LEKEHMVSRDARQDSMGDPPQEAQQVLNALTQELKNLQQDVVVQLAQDVARLQSEKSRLIREIQALNDRQSPFPKDLAQESGENLSSAGFDTQQQWTRHLAQSIADHLHEQIAQPMRDSVSADAPPSASLPTDRHTVLDRRLTTSYGHLEGDLADRRSILSQQLRRMENLQQQGEAILTALIDRMSQPLHSPAEGVLLPPETGDPPIREGRTLPLSPPTSINVRSAFVSSVLPESSSSLPKTRIFVRKGLVFAFLSTALLALFNLSIKLIFQESTLFGQSPGVSWSGILDPSWSNVLFISFLRMAIVMLLVPVMARWLYPSVWRDLRQFTAPRNLTRQGQVIGSGVCLFLSQIFVYRAIGQIPTAVALSLFFIFPVLTILGGWVLLGERPTPSRWGIGVIVLLGCLFCLPNWGVSGSGSDFTDGTLTAILAGAAFAGYVSLAQLCGKHLHPIPFSFVNFSVSFFLSGIILLVTSITGGPVDVPGGQEWTLLGWGVGLGVLSALSYILNTLAIRYSGATLSSIVGATIPMLTALFGWSIINEPLQNHQIFGVVLVTIGAIGLSLERLFQWQQHSKHRSRNVSE
jgi:drug/metabolite transporter (DMT)-like permease